MIRRHFLAGVVGLKAMCAAAALMVGVGQAEAATVTHNIVFTVTDAYDRYYPDYGTDPSLPPSRTNRDEFWGFKVGEALNGTLTITKECVNLGCLMAKLIVAGTTLYDQKVSGTFDAFEGIKGSSGYLWEYIAWDGISGLFQYTYDNSPIVTYADATIELAPVPLPMAGTLLPVGIGALAMMRKRRKSGQAGTV